MKRFLAGLLLSCFAVLALPYSSTEVPGACVMTDLIARGSVWKYLDTGVSLGMSDIVVGNIAYDSTNWKHPGYDDSAWMSGPAQLGYGETQATTLGFGPSSTNKYITSYFRRTFTVSDPSEYQQLYLSLWRDDGAVVYVNGQEVLRTNMPTGMISSTTVAASAMDTVFEYRAMGVGIDSSLLVAGNNTIAVEIHQVNVTSSDIIFDLQLRNIGCGSLCENPDTRMVAIGDMGVDSQGQRHAENERSIAELTHIFDPDLVITMGDNNYPTGGASTIDRNIGKYYRQYIGNYVGTYGAGAGVNRFFPVLGNHDWGNVSPGGNISAYLNYFTLPNNERYYTFSSPSIDFVNFDSDTNEPDGTLGINPVTLEPASVQSAWVKNTLQNSDKQWKLVYFHHPPFSTSHYGNAVYMQWPFGAWGATLVMNGHEHGYERLQHGGLDYVINGGGGAQLRNDRVTTNSGELASSRHYEVDQHTLVYIESSPTCFHMQTISVTGEVIDSVLQEVIPDTLPPTVTVEQGGHPDPDPDSTVYFDISLSEAVTGFSTEDILISGSATAQVVALVGMGTSYQVAISDVGDGESVTVSIPANTMNDLAGNPNLASTSTDNTITVLYPRPGQCADTSGAGFTQFTDITTPCRVGTLTTGDTVGDDGLYDWTCVGVNGGGDTACTAAKKRINQACTDLPTNAQWNTASVIDQVFDGAVFAPALSGVWNMTPSTSACVFECQAGYMWSTDQSLCQPIPSVCGGDAGDAFASSLMMTDLCDTGSVNALDIGHDMTADDGIYNWSCTTGVTEVDCQAYRSQIVACEGLPAHAHWNTASSITQIFNGTQFLPTITGIHDVAGSMAACYFVCDAGYAWDGTQCEATVVALCGDDHGTSSLSAPDALCAAGAPSIVAQTGTTWDWTCLGAGGGADAVCHTVRSICGDATPQSGEQCDDGNTLNLDGCSSTCQLESPVNGACGASEGTFFTSQPLTELCDAGTPTAVTGSGPWSWTCLGQSLGAHDTCQTLSTGGGGGGSSSASTSSANTSSPPPQEPSGPIISSNGELHYMQEVTSELILNAAPEEPEMIPADQCAVWNTVDFDCTERSDCVQQYASSIHLTRSTLIDWIWLGAGSPTVNHDFDIPRDVPGTLRDAYIFMRDIGAVSDRERFSPDRAPTRTEAYTILFRSFCIPIISTSAGHARDIYETARDHHATRRSWTDFAPDRQISQREFLHIFFRLFLRDDRGG